MTDHATGVDDTVTLKPITVYISGPMRGYPRYNFDAFYEAEAYVDKFWAHHREVTVLNPARKDEEAGFDPDGEDEVTETELQRWMRRDVTDVAAADRILLLPGWEKSEGARRELSVARWCGLDPWLYMPPVGEAEWGHTTEPGESGDTLEQRYDVLAEICNEADELKAAQEYVPPPSYDITPSPAQQAFDEAVEAAEADFLERGAQEIMSTFFAQPEQQKSLRASALEEAQTLITGDRNNTYGPPHQDFQRSADMLTALMADKLKDGEHFAAHEIAQIIILVKLSRLQWTPTKRDSWVDIAGYAGCGYEAAELAG